MTEVQTKPVGQTNAPATANNESNAKPNEVAAKATRGGRRTPDGTKITFHIEDEATMTKLKARAKAEHRSPENMASYILHQMLHTEQKTNG